MKLINPKLDQFEADIMSAQAKADQPAGIAIPVGHISFKLMKVDKNHAVASGRLMVRTEDKDASGEFSLLLNDVPLPPPPANNPGNAPETELKGK